MEQNAQKQFPQRRRIFSLVAWTFIVSSGVFEIVTHPQRAGGLHGFLTGLGVFVGIMCIFSEITGLLREPK
jgi:hypothetical protein